MAARRQAGRGAPVPYKLPSETDARVGPPVLTERELVDAATLLNPALGKHLADLFEVLPRDGNGNVIAEVLEVERTKGYVAPFQVRGLCLCGVGCGFVCLTVGGGEGRRPFSPPATPPSSPLHGLIAICPFVPPSPLLGSCSQSHYSQQCRGWTTST